MQESMYIIKMNTPSLNIFVLEDPYEDFILFYYTKVGYVRGAYETKQANFSSNLACCNKIL